MLKIRTSMMSPVGIAAVMGMMLLARGAFAQQQTGNTQAVQTTVQQATSTVVQVLTQQIGSAAVAGSGPANFGGPLVRFQLPGQGETGAAGAAGGKAWNAWMAFSNNSVANTFQPTSTDGRVRLWSGGVDHTFQNRVRVGLAVAGDQSDINLTGSTFAGGGTLRGRGYTIAPYLGVPLNANWSFDATVGYGRTKMDLNQGVSSGSFDSKRTIGAVGLNYSQALNRWILGGRMALNAAETRLGSYTQSNNTFVDGSTLNSAQARLGVQAGYAVNANVMPYVGLTYIYDVRRADQAPVAGQTPSNDRDAWNAAVGIRFSAANSLYGGIQYSSDRNRSQIKNDQWLLNLGVRF